MIVEETEKIEVIDKIRTSIVCDVCKKTIAKRGEVGTNFLELIISTREKGSENHNSFEQLEICSDDCLKIKFEEYLKTKHDKSYFGVSGNHSDNYLYYKNEVIKLNE